MNLNKDFSEEQQSCSDTYRIYAFMNKVQIEKQIAKVSIKFKTNRFQNLISQGSELL